MVSRVDVSGFAFAGLAHAAEAKSRSVMMEAAADFCVASTS